MNRYVEIDSNEVFEELIAVGRTFEHYVFQNVTFSRNALQCRFRDSLFMGCTMPDAMRDELGDDCLVFPRMNKPYNMFPSHLYTARQLYEGFDKAQPSTYACCYDARIYNHYIAKGKQAEDYSEAFARSLHDNSISDALHDFLSHYDDRKVVAVMGGHSLLRTDETYRKIVIISRNLSNKGCLMVTGGGPGAMEAAHLGVWLAGYDDAAVDSAISMLSAAPSYKDEGWLSTAFGVMDKFPRLCNNYSVGIPTWFYGHEPATPFATHIAKYFDNSIREDGLLAIAKGGVIYAPGSAGTMQEIFQDAAQNHYLTCGYASPMVFLGVKYWSEEFPVYPLLQGLHTKGCYRNLILSLTDEPYEAEDAVLTFIKQK